MTTLHNMDCINGKNHVIKVSPVDYGGSTQTRNNNGASAAILCDKFMDYSSSHGFAHIKRIQSRRGKSIWVILTLAGISVAIWQCYTVINAFLKHEYNTLMDIKFDAKARFPVITLCNLNPYRSTHLMELASHHPELKHQLQRYEHGNDTENKFQELEGLLLTINRLDATTKLRIGHQLEDMLVTCNFGPTPCGVRNFTTTPNYEFGNCYSFNEAANSFTNRAGPRYGLSLLLFTEIEEYVAELAGSNGFKLIIHDHNQVPFPEEQGFHISAGFKTQIGIRRFEMKRLGSPYYDCHPSSTTGSLNHYHADYPNSYSRPVCIRSCFQNNVISSCGCYFDQFPVPITMNNQTHPCSETEKSKMCSAIMYDQYFADNTVDVDTFCPGCHPVCKEVKYYATYSQSMFPVPQEEFLEQYIESITKASPAFYEWFESLEEQNMSLELLNEKSRYALASVEIFFDELNYEYVYQKPASTLTDMISNLGGQLGLWIGMSLLSVFEYFELFGRLLLFGCRSCGNRDMRHQSENSDLHNPPI